MFIWTTNKIHWYQQAANYTKYYKEIFQEISPHIKDSDHVCDLGCGLGDLSIELATIADEVTSIDISKEALAVLKEKKHAKKVTNINVIKKDWADLKLKPQWDVVVVSFFRQNYEDFIKLLKMARRKIIVVSTNGSEDNFLPRQKKHRNEGKINDLKTIFNDHGLRFKCIERTVQFGQPLASIDDTRNYIKTYVPDCEEDVMEKHIEDRLIKITEGDFAGQYFFSNNKEIGIFVIEKDEAIKKLPEFR